MLTGGLSGMMYFGIVDELVARLLMTLQAALEAVFGTSIRPIFEGSVEAILTLLMEFWWDLIITAVNTFLYNILISLLFLLDLLSYSFDIFTGMQHITVNTVTGKKDTMFNLIFYHDNITRAFWGIALIACILCVVFTLFAVMRSMMDLEGRRPVGKVLGMMGKSILTFLMIPFISMAGINLAGTVMTQAARTISGQSATAGKVSLGTQIFTSVAQDATRQHVITPEEAAIEIFLKISTGVAQIVINPLGGMLQLYIEAMVATAGLIGNNIQTGPDSWNQISPRMTAMVNQVVYSEGYTLNTPAANKRLQELITQHFNDGGEYSIIAELTENLGLGRMPYLDTGYVMEFIKPHLVHSLIGIICVVCIGVFMLMAAFIFARRIFEVLLLYIVSPFFAATMPLDDGQKFKAWREQFIGKVMSGYGIVFSMRIFLLMVPIIFSANIRFIYLPVIDDIIRLIILVAAAASVLKSHTLIAKIIGGESSAEAEASGLGGKAFSMVMAPATYVASSVGGEIKKQASSVYNSALSSVSGAVRQGAHQTIAYSTQSIIGSFNKAFNGSRSHGARPAAGALGISRNGHSTFARPSFSVGGSASASSGAGGSRSGRGSSSAYSISQGPGQRFGVAGGADDGSNAFTGDNLLASDPKANLIDGLNETGFRSDDSSDSSNAYSGGSDSRPDLRDVVRETYGTSGTASDSYTGYGSASGSEYSGGGYSGGSQSKSAYNPSIPQNAQRNISIVASTYSVPTASNNPSDRLNKHFEQRKRSMQEGKLSRRAPGNTPPSGKGG